MKVCTRVLAFVLTLTILTASRAWAAGSHAVHHSVACATAPLGSAQPYNGFFLNNVQENGSGIAGRLAIGGNAALSDYSVGASVPATPPQDVLVVGGAIDFARGVINGNAVYGNTSTMSNTSMGNGVARQGHPVDFNAVTTELNRLVQRVTHLARNGRTSDKYGVVTLHGTKPGRTVFHLSSARLGSAHVVRVMVPARSTVVIVVSGGTAAIHDLGLSLRGVSGSRLLMVFPTATTLDIHGVGLQNSILAPHAAIKFNNGAIDGTVIGSTLTGTGHLGSTAFVGCLPAS